MATRLSEFPNTKAGKTKSIDAGTGLGLRSDSDERSKARGFAKRLNRPAVLMLVLSIYVLIALFAETAFHFAG